jgi:Golgi phosphoprotein 3
MSVTLAEAFFLCAIPPDGIATSTKVPAGIGGAIVAELVLGGRIRVEEEGVHALDPAPTGDDLLDPVLEGAKDPNARQTRATWFIANVGKVQTPKVHQRLIAGGLATLEKGEKRRLLGSKPDRLKPTPAGEEPRARLRAVLLGEAEPDARDAVLAGLAAACDIVKLHVPDDQRAAATQRAEALAQGEAIPEHVRTAIRGSQRATAAVIAGST